MNALKYKFVNNYGIFIPLYDNSIECLTSLKISTSMHNDLLVKCPLIYTSIDVTTEISISKNTNLGYMYIRNKCGEILRDYFAKKKKNGKASTEANAAACMR